MARTPTYVRYRINLLPEEKFAMNKFFALLLTVLIGSLLLIGDVFAAESKRLEADLGQAPKGRKAKVEQAPAEVDIIADAEQRAQANTDVAKMKARLKKSAKNNATLSEAEAVEKELAEIKEARLAKQRVAEEALKRSEAVRRLEARNRASALKAEEEKMRKEVLDDEDITGISSDEAAWRGLE